MKRKDDLAVGQILIVEQAVAPRAPLLDRLGRVDKTEVEKGRLLVDLSTSWRGARSVRPLWVGSLEGNACGALFAQVVVVGRHSDVDALVALGPGALALGLIGIARYGRADDVVAEVLAERDQEVAPARVGRIDCMNLEREKASARQLELLVHDRRATHVAAAVHVVGGQHASIGGVHCAPPEVLQVVALAVVAAVRVQLVAHDSHFGPLLYV